MIFKVFRASLTLAAAGYIGPGNPEGGGNFPLGQGDGAAQPVPQANDLRLPGGQTLPDDLVEPERAVPVVDIVQHGVIHAHHIHQLEGIALLVCLNGIRQRDFSLELFLAAEVHENFVFNAAGGVGGQAGALLRVEAGDALDEADGADGDQVLLIGALGIVFLDDVGHQAQVPLDEYIPGLLISLGVAAEIFPLLCGGQRLWKRPAAGQAE